MGNKLGQLAQSEFAHLQSIYFNSAYFGPSPFRAKAAVEKALQRELDPAFYAYDDWMAIPDRVRGKWSQLLQAPSDNIFHSSAVGTVFSHMVNGLKLNANDKVVLLKDDYPSVVLPWMLAQEKRGISLEFIQSSLPTADWLKNNLPKDTKVFCLSHVAFQTGRKVDLVSIGQLMKERDIIFMVDCTQSLGGMRLQPNELGNIDVLACAVYKWMLGPYGMAMGYLSDRMINLTEHTHASWINSINSKNANDLLRYTNEVLPGARKFDRGQSPNMLAMAAMEGSLDFFNECDLDEINNYNQSLLKHFLDNYPKGSFEKITPDGGESNILCLRSKKEFKDIKSLMAQEKIDFSIREGNLRLSFHLFNTLEQVNKLIEALERALKA